MRQRWNRQHAIVSLIVLGSFWFSSWGRAASAPFEGELYSDYSYYPDYYTVNESPSENSKEFPKGFPSPVEVLTEILEQAHLEQATEGMILDLMSWAHHEEELEAPLERYNRKAHYGGWIRDSRDGTCFNTRAKVLIRSSEVPITFSASGCAVARGRWFDPYSNRYYTEARDLQVDHVVPLKNSYVSGGWKWQSQKRCLYANFMSNKYHLLAVNGPDNMRKGDRTPAAFMPPNPAFACEYLTIWLKIKLIWNLAMVPSEARAISDLVMQNHCDPDTLSMSIDELNRQRNQILENADLCSASH